MTSKLNSPARRALLPAWFLPFASALVAQDPPTPKPEAKPAELATPAQPPKPKLVYDTLIERGPQLLGQQPVAVWIPGTHDAAFLLPDGSAIVRRSPGQTEAVSLIDATALCAKLGIPSAEGKPAMVPPFSFVNPTTLRIELEAAVWHVALEGGEAKAVLRWPLRLDARDDHVPLAIAPHDRHAAWVLGSDLSVASQNGRTRRLTFDGSSDVVYGGAAHRAEFGIATGLFWSPDGRYLAFYREDQRPIDAYPYQDPLTTPPASRHGRYPMAGRKHSCVTVGIYDAEEEELHWLDHDDAQDLYWTNVTFAPDSKSLVVALVSRGQDHLELASFRCADGRRIGTLLEEHDREWVEPEHGPWFLPDGRFLWWSSGDGHCHLYLHGNDGARLLQVTKGAFDVQGLLEVDATRGSLWFTASGEDPRQLHLHEAKLDGSEVKQITRDRGTHICSLSPDAKFAFDTWSNLETPPQSRFVDLQTGAVESLPQAPMPLLDFELPQSRMFQVKADDDTVLYGNVLLPRELAEGQKLPALLYVYGGPHLQQVTDTWLGNASLWLHALANHGYVVCRLDNRGSPHRGIGFEQSVFRQLGTIEVRDQLGAVEWLKQQPFVDSKRLGVHGWSYGGYMTLRLLGMSPGTFRCGISGAPVTDWTMYETGYTERYMDTPGENGEGYLSSSCLPLAEKLQDRLLIVHGTDDRTVMWSHTLQFVDRCIAAGKLIDYMPYPNQTHRLVGPDRVHFQRLLKDYLDRWLGGT